MFAVAMQEVFVPDLSSSYRWLSFAAVVAIAAAVWTISAYRGGIASGKKVGQTVGPLLALCGIIGVTAVILDMTRSPIIIMTPEYLLLGNDTVPNAQLRRVYLEPVAVGGGYGANSKTEELAVFEYADGTSMLLSAGQYDTRAVVETADRIMGK